MILYAAALLATVGFQNPSGQPQPEGADPARPAIIQWDTRGFCPAFLPGTGNTSPATIAMKENPGVLVDMILRSAGLFGAPEGDTGGSVTWTVFDKSLVATLWGGEAAKGAGPYLAGPPSRLDKHPDLPSDWMFGLGQNNALKGVSLTVDLNAARTSAEPLFDAPWLQRIIDRLAVSNARLVSLRATLHPAPADNLPPLLELKAVASARSEKPGKPLIPHKLISPGWGGSKEEAAAIAGAHWAASLRSDSAGLGQIGRDGGVGTWAGLIRLAVDTVGTAQTADTAAWHKTYTAWQDRSADALRGLSTRLQSRATLACYGSAAAPDLVLIIPARTGERTDTLISVMDQLSKPCSLDVAKGIWTTTATGPLAPKLAITVSGTSAGAFLIVSLEHDANHALLQQTATRLRAAK